MSMTVRLENRPGIPLAVVKRQALPSELGRVVPDACGAVWKVVRERKFAGAGRNVAIYRDSLINLEVGVELLAPWEPSGEVITSATPAGLVAAVTHFGPYQLLLQAHEAVQHWCEEHDYRLVGPSWEIYGHWREAWNTNPGLIETEVCYLVTPT